MRLQREEAELERRRASGGGCGPASSRPGSRANWVSLLAVCTSALNLALQAGIEQVNQQIDAATFADELHQLLDEQPEQVTDRIRLELDLGETSEI